MYHLKRPATPGGGGGGGGRRGGHSPPPHSPPPPHIDTHSFVQQKEKKGKQRKKERVSKDFKGETTNRLTPRSKCYHFTILEHLELKNFSVFHGSSTLKYISPALLKVLFLCFTNRNSGGLGW